MGSLGPQEKHQGKHEAASMTGRGSQPPAVVPVSARAPPHKGSAKGTKADGKSTPERERRARAPQQKVIIIPASDHALPHPMRPSAASRNATQLPVLLLALTALACGVAQAANVVPAESACRATFDSLGVNNLLLRLAPCQSGPSAQCCSTGLSLAGFQAGAPLAGDVLAVAGGLLLSFICVSFICARAGQSVHCSSLSLPKAVRSSDGLRLSATLHALCPQVVCA